MGFRRLNIIAVILMYCTCTMAQNYNVSLANQWVLHSIIKSTQSADTYIPVTTIDVYDSSGLLIQVVNIDEPPNNTLITDTTNAILPLQLVSTTTITQVSNFTYNSNFKLASETSIEYGGITKQTEISTYKYQTNNVVNKTRIDPEGEVSKTTYKLATDGSILMKRYNYVLNKDGNITEQWLQTDKAKKKEVSKYKYNNNKELIEKTEYYNKQLLYTMLYAYATTIPVVHTVKVFKTTGNLKELTTTDILVKNASGVIAKYYRILPQDGITHTTIELAQVITPTEQQQKSLLSLLSK